MEKVFESLDDALVAVVPSMELVDGEVISFKVQAFPEAMGVTTYRLTLKEYGGKGLFPRVECLYKEVWEVSSESSMAMLAIAFVQKARSEGFWLSK